MRYLFGNPGTTELPLNDALASDRRFEYILGVHEVPLVAMADGYAMASGRIGVLNVHVSCGLGNSMGMLYNAFIEGTPLLLTAGQQDRRLRLGEPVLQGDTVSVARPWTKWAYEVERVEDVPVAVRRAVQVALTPPTGPVFLSLPLDVQMESASGLDVSPPSLCDGRIRPAKESVERALEVLSRAKRPAILAGSRVTEAGACDELGRFAELLGAPVFAECATSHGRLPMSPRHPLYAGSLPLWIPDVRAKLAEFDVLCVVGMNLLRLYLQHGDAPPLSESTSVVHLDIRPWEIGKNFPVDVGLLGDVREGLRELCDGLTSRQTPEQRTIAGARTANYGAAHAAARETLWREIDAVRDRRPMTASNLMAALARVLPPHAAVVEEAVTTHQTLLERLGAWGDPTGHFAHRGWALGWGMGCALGVKLAWPDRPVVGLIGDGAALYGLQALWTAAAHRIPVTFVICNNAQYRILKVCGDVMPLPQMQARNYVAMDLTAPETDYVAAARAFGVEAERVTSPDELSDRLRSALTRDRPLLLDVPIER